MARATIDVDLPTEIFGVRTNVPLIHQVVVAQLAAARQGTHSTKTRAEVRGGGRKPYKQKGTGRARQGSIRAPQFAGGGIVHGPKPRDYSQRTPKKMKSAALRGALSDRARHDRIHVVESIVSGDVPSTKAAAALLAGLSDRKNLLVVLDRTDTVSFKSVRNLEDVHVLAVDQLNTYDVLCADDVVFTETAYQQLVAPLDRDRDVGAKSGQGAEVDVNGAGADQAPKQDTEGVAATDGLFVLQESGDIRNLERNQLLDAAHEAARQQMGKVRSNRSSDPTIDGWSVTTDDVEFVAIERHRDHVLVTWPSTLSALEAVEFFEATVRRADAVYAEGADDSYLAFEEPDEGTDWGQIAKMKDLRFLRADVGPEILIWKAPPREGLRDNRFQVMEARVDGPRLLQLIHGTTKRDVISLLDDYLGSGHLDFEPLSTSG